MNDLLTAARALLDTWGNGGYVGITVERWGELLDNLGAAVDDLERSEFTTTETTELLSAELIGRARRTGVIVAVDRDTTTEHAIMVQEQLSERFPEVRFAVVWGASSLVFEWDDPDDEAVA